MFGLNGAGERKMFVFPKMKCRISETCSQPLMAQQQRCPHGFGLTLDGSEAFLSRSMKYFLLRSAFFLQTRHPSKKTVRAEGNPAVEIPTVTK